MVQKNCELSKTIQEEDILFDSSIGYMIEASLVAYRNNEYLTTEELIKEIKEKDKT